MREPKRIPETIELIQTTWSVNPDLRLMQLLINAINPKNRCPELYYLEDDELVRLLKINNNEVLLDGKYE